jgi:4-hydroxybutyryl-CoA dehydratase/vinylacetyl-CoA-Delta-isomerase
MHDICGGLVMNMPREADFRSEELSGYLHKYLHTKSSVDVEDRARLFNFIRDTTADAFGGWEMIATIQGGGGLQAQRLVTYRSYDLEAAKQTVRDAIGLSGANPRRARH